jgi:opacity protein-like surface antigen
MKSKMLALIGVMTAPLGALGAAEAQTYVAASVGANGSTDVDYYVNNGGFGPSGVNTTNVDGGYGFDVAIGQHFGNWRAELAYSYSDWDEAVPQNTELVGTHSGSGMMVQAIDLNGYYDFPVDGQLRPYVGAGVGFATVKFDDEVVNSSDNSVHLQALGGVSMPFTSNLTAFAEARYQFGTAPIAPQPPQITDEETDFGALGFRAGLRLTF